MHRGEIHNKLVGIMRERLIASLKQLPGLALQWEAGGPATEPSAFSQGLVKQLKTLTAVSLQLSGHKETLVVWCHSWPKDLVASWSLGS